MRDFGGTLTGDGADGNMRALRGALHILKPSTPQPKCTSGPKS